MGGVEERTTLLSRDNQELDEETSWSEAQSLLLSQASERKKLTVLNDHKFIFTQR